MAAVGGVASLATVRAELREVALLPDGSGVELVVRNPSPLWPWTFDASAEVAPPRVAFGQASARIGPGGTARVVLQASGPASPCEVFRIRVKPRGLPWGDSRVEGRLSRDCPA